MTCYIHGPLKKMLELEDVEVLGVDLDHSDIFFEKAEKSWVLEPSKLAEFVDFSLRSFNETKGYGFIESADTAAIYGKEQHGTTGRFWSFEGCRLDDHGNKKTYLTFEVIKQLGFNHGFRAFLADFPWVFRWFSSLFVGVSQALTGALPLPRTSLF